MSQSKVTVERDGALASDADASSNLPDLTHDSSSDIALEQIQSEPPTDVRSLTSSPAGKRIIIVVATLTGVNFLSSLSNGLLTVGLPRIASDTALPEHLQLW